MLSTGVSTVTNDIQQISSSPSVPAEATYPVDPNSARKESVMPDFDRGYGIADATCSR